MKNWFKKYIWYLLITALSSVLGAALVYLIPKKNFGSIADCVSGIGALGAIVVAFWQIAEQRKKEENDKILANKPIFSLYKRTFVNRKTDNVWALPKDCGEAVKLFIEQANEQDKTVHFKKDIYAYFFKNITQAAATSVTLKIEYQNKNTGETDRTDYCTIETCVDGKETAIILPDSIIRQTTEYAVCPKKIFLYFSTIDGDAYCQRWTEIEESGIYHFQEEDTDKIKKKDIPKKGICSFTNFS